MIAVVTVAAGRHDHLRLQLDGLREAVARPDLHVVVAMGDPQIHDLCAGVDEVVDLPLVDGRLPLAAARNLGAREALRRGADRLVFLDVDCVPAPDFLSTMTGSLDDATSQGLTSGRVGYLPPPSPGGYRLADLAANAREHPARQVGSTPATALDHTQFWSLCFGVTADVWQRIGGFDEGYTGYGGEDTDFGERAREAGVAHVMLAGAWVYHQWHPSPDPPLGHVDDILRNARRFRDRWDYWPMSGWLEAFAGRGLVHHDDLADDWLRLP